MGFVVIQPDLTENFNGFFIGKLSRKIVGLEASEMIIKDEGGNLVPFVSHDSIFGYTVIVMQDDYTIGKRYVIEKAPKATRWPQSPEIIPWMMTYWYQTPPDFSTYTPEKNVEGDVLKLHKHVNSNWYYGKTINLTNIIIAGVSKAQSPYPTTSCFNMVITFSCHSTNTTYSYWLMQYSIGWGLNIDQMVISAATSNGAGRSNIGLIEPFQEIFYEYKITYNNSTYELNAIINPGNVTKNLYGITNSNCSDRIVRSIGDTTGCGGMDVYIDLWHDYLLVAEKETDFSIISYNPIYHIPKPHLLT